MSPTLHWLVRLLVASFLGALVGLERESSHRPAGLRTHTLVAMGSALVMILSKEAFQTFLPGSWDPGRLAAQVVSGIGFLGAGTILREGVTVRGLTTAASLWVVAGIGLAIGAGFYAAGIAATLLATFILFYVHRVENFFFPWGFTTLKLEKEGALDLEAIARLLRAEGIKIRRVNTETALENGVVRSSAFFILRGIAPAQQAKVALALTQQGLAKKVLFGE